MQLRYLVKSRKGHTYNQKMQCRPSLRLTISDICEERMFNSSKLDNLFQLIPSYELNSTKLDLIWQINSFINPKIDKLIIINSKNHQFRYSELK